MSFSKVDSQSIIRKTVVLQVTENCNLNCTYCYQHSKKRSVIDEAVLKNIILDCFAADDGFEEVEFDFIGGEPLLCMPLIRRVCEWVWSEPRPKKYIFFATTNGVGLKESDKQWFTEHKDAFWLGISLDGTKEMQDKNRSGSYDRIDRAFFLRNWPEQHVKMTVSPYTVGSFADGVIDLCNFGFRVAANLAYGVDWSSPDIVSVLERELKKLIDYYFEHEGIEPIMWLNLPLSRITGQETEPQRWCGSGFGMEAYDIYGKRFPCHMFYGTTGDSIDGWESLDFDKIYKQYYQNCCLKPLFNICPICVGMAYSGSGSRFECDPHLCKLMRVFFRANAYFQAEKIIRKKRVRDFGNYTAKSMVAGIITVNDLLNNKYDGNGDF